MEKEFSVIDLLDQSFQLYPNEDYLFDGETAITYKQLYQETQALANSLNRIGVAKGDRVLVCLPNWHEFVTILFSLAKIGAIIIPCNPCYRTEDLEPILDNGEIKAAFIAENEYLHPFLHEKGIQAIFTVRYQKRGYFSYHSLVSSGKNDEKVLPAKIDPERDVMVILYSSGTTGKPKGIMLTHRNLLYATKTTKNYLNCTSADSIFTPVPVFHIFGLVPGVLLTVLTGAKIIFMDKYDKRKALQLIEKGKATIHLGVPTMFILELNVMNEVNYDLSSLRTGIIAGSSCPSDVVRKIRHEMGCNIKISYGMTETSSSVTFTSFSDDEKTCSETVGKAVPGTEIKVVDKNRKIVPNGTIGELAVRGIGIMRGYYQMPEKTNEVLDSDGWFYTSDIAIIDEEGYCSIVGRKKEMITRGGYKIYPREVEELLYKHPNVIDVAIVGAPNPVLGESSYAFVKTKQYSCEREETIKSYLSDKTVWYKVPDHVIFIDEFPINHNGKIQKNVLKETAIGLNQVFEFV